MKEFHCTACGHIDTVHFMWSGCCGHDGCKCESFDDPLKKKAGTGCPQKEHGAACWWSK